MRSVNFERLVEGLCASRSLGTRSRGDIADFKVQIYF